MSRSRKSSPFSAGAFVLLWPRVAADGRMAGRTATQFSTAGRKVLSVIVDWHRVDMRELDIDDVVRQFKINHGGVLGQGTLQTYESCFRRAVPSFLAYVEDPGSWEPPVHRRVPESTRAHAEGDGVQIWLPSGRFVRVDVPPDLDEVEVELLLDLIPIYLRAAVTVRP